MDTPLTLDAAMDVGAYFLEGHHYADYWHIDGIGPRHYCNDCGALIDEDLGPDCGCRACGFGRPLDDDQEAA